MRSIAFLTRFFVLAPICAASAACGDDAPTGDDAGALDAGFDAGTRDAGPLVWMPDAGTRSEDTGSPRDADPAETRACAERRDRLQPFLLPRCQASTRTCVEGCGGTGDEADACRDACLDADSYPAHPQFGLVCRSCVLLQLFACITEAGCDEGVRELFCCLADRCPEGSPDGCGEQRCGPELEAALTCGYFADESCLDFAGGLSAQCYEEGDGDAGTN